MKEIFPFYPKLLICILFLLPVKGLHSQTSAQFDDIVSEIYNQSFSAVPSKIEKLKTTSPQTANYLQIDYLWWNMISENSDANEAEFLRKLEDLNNSDKGSSFENFNKLIYFTYQIRYENLKNKSLSKYLTLLKFHFFMDHINLKKPQNPDAFTISMFGMMTELDTFMKYKFLTDHGFKTKNNLEKCQLSLQKIEGMSNLEYKSFDVVKTYLLAKIYLEIENDPRKALAKFTKLGNQFPQNTIFKQSISDCKNRLDSMH
ncbi:MAG: hypothetical protein WC384_17675 [Prolixibacteraceae bacterium]|jgi:hypothetical protein